MVDRETKTETHLGSRETSGGKREPVRARLLGGFSVRVGDRIIERDEWRLRKAAALVKLLALAPDHRLHRERIMDRLWPHLEAEGGPNNLRRPSTPPAGRSTRPLARATWRPTRQLGAVSRRSLWVDVEAFEAAAPRPAANASPPPTARRSTSTPGSCSRRPLRGLGGGPSPGTSAAEPGAPVGARGHLRGARRDGRPSALTSDAEEPTREEAHRPDAPVRAFGKAGGGAQAVRTSRRHSPGSSGPSRTLRAAPQGGDRCGKLRAAAGGTRPADNGRPTWGSTTCPRRGPASSAGSGKWSR